MKRMDRDIKILAWVIAITIFTFIFVLSAYEAEFNKLTESEPAYGLAIMFIPAVIICFIANILGKSARSSNVGFGYIRTKLFMQPIIWVSALASALVASFLNGS